MKIILEMIVGGPDQNNNKDNINKNKVNQKKKNLKIIIIQKKSNKTKKT